MNVDARHSNIYQASGSQLFLDHMVDANTMLTIESIMIVIRNTVEGTWRISQENTEFPSGTCRQNVIEDVAIHEIIVCSAIITCTIAVLYTLQAVFQRYMNLS